MNQHTIHCPHTTDGMCQNCVNLWTASIRESFARQNDDICQTLGKALGFPWYKDDQVNFPGATEVNGVCVGDHVAESLAEVAAKEIERLRAREIYLLEMVDRCGGPDE